MSSTGKSARSATAARRHESHRRAGLHLHRRVDQRTGCCHPAGWQGMRRPASATSAPAPCTMRLAVAEGRYAVGALRDRLGQHWQARGGARRGRAARRSTRTRVPIWRAQDLKQKLQEIAALEMGGRPRVTPSRAAGRTDDLRAGGRSRDRRRQFDGLRCRRPQRDEASVTALAGQADRRGARQFPRRNAVIGCLVRRGRSRRETGSTI
jgi:hypothetical protein